LLRILGKSSNVDADVSASVVSEAVAFSSSRAFGDVWTLNCLWKELGLNQLGKVLRTRHRIDIEALIKIMVMNRLCNPDSKSGVLRWLNTVSFPDVTAKAVTHQHLLRAMDVVVEYQDKINGVLNKAIGKLIDKKLSIVFYDMTTVKAEGLSHIEDDIRCYGMSKSSLIERQFLLGLVQTSEGIPLYHEVYEGNTAEVRTLSESIDAICHRYPIERIIIVADRGLLSLDNIALLEEKGIEYILAVPGRRYKEFHQNLDKIALSKTERTDEFIGEGIWKNKRLVVLHNEAVAKEQTHYRRQTIQKLEELASTWTNKLNNQDRGKRTKGRQLSDEGAKAKFYHEVCEMHLKNIIKVDLKGDLFNYRIDEKALSFAEKMDGKLLLITNVKDLTAKEITEQYKNLSDIERGFKILKSEIQIAPVYHRLRKRIKAHAMICFMALVLYRIMRKRLKEDNSEKTISPEHALRILKQIQTHEVKKGKEQKSVKGISSINEEQAKIFQALRIKKPTNSTQYVNL